MSIENITPKKGEIAFVWFNSYAGVTVKTPTKTLVIDPVDIDAKAFKKVDAVLITQEHYDHLDQAVVNDIQKRTECEVIADPTSAPRLAITIPAEKLHEIRENSEFKVGNVTVKAQKCNHPAATPITFLITSEDGVKIYHTADSLPFPEMRSIGDSEKPDIVFCTVGAIAPGASPKTGVEIAKLLRPKVAIPYHTASKADLNNFSETLAKEAPNIKCLIIEQGKPQKYP